ncbi:hypothetical protein CKA32_004085 [Geitlerinema sp. FC II]|nr:hypothetical protein CKA32_004085 [Geitlerinema sp. FC II]
MTALLMNNSITPVPTQNLHQIFSLKISRDFYKLEPPIE